MAIFNLHHPLVFTFGILGNIVSIFVYFAPLPTFIQICKRKSTMGFQSLPYVVALFSAMLWMYYAFLKVDAILLITINTIGCIIESIYILIFLIYATAHVRKQTAKLLGALTVGLFSVIFLGTFFLIEGPQRVVVVGWICVAVSVSVFAAPLSIVFQVVKTKSVEFMPFLLSFFLTLSAVMWFGYGILQSDLCVAIPNIFGFFLGVIQMVLYGFYKNVKNAAVMDKKLSEHIINIVMVSNPEVHPVDSRTSSNVSEIGAASIEDGKNNEQSAEKEDKSGKCIDLGANNEPCSQVANVKPLDSPMLIVCSA